MAIDTIKLTTTIEVTAAAALLCLSLVCAANEAMVSPVNTSKWFHQTQLPNGRIPGLIMNSNIIPTESPMPISAMAP